MEKGFGEAVKEFLKRLERRESSGTVYPTGKLSYFRRVMPKRNRRQTNNGAST